MTNVEASSIWNKFLKHWKVFKWITKAGLLRRCFFSVFPGLTVVWPSQDFSPENPDIPTRKGCEFAGGKGTKTLSAGWGWNGRYPRKTQAIWRYAVWPRRFARASRSPSYGVCREQLKTQEVEDGEGVGGVVVEDFQFCGAKHENLRQRNTIAVAEFA